MLFLFCGEKAFLARKNVLFIDSRVNSRTWVKTIPCPAAQPHLPLLLIAKMALNAILNKKEKRTLIWKFEETEKYGFVDSVF